MFGCLWQGVLGWGKYEMYEVGAGIAGFAHGYGLYCVY